MNLRLTARSCSRFATIPTGAVLFLGRVVDPSAAR